MTALPIEGYAREYTDPAALMADYRARKARLAGLPVAPQPNPAPQPVDVINLPKPTPIFRPSRYASNGSRWAAEEVETLKAMATDGATRSQIARILKRSSTAVKEKAYQLRIPVALKKAPDIPAAVAYYRLAFSSGLTGDMTASQKASEIVRSVAEAGKINPADIMGKSRTAPTVAARHAAIWLVAKENTAWSYPQIGKFFGIDHTSVLHAVRKENERRGENLRGAGFVPDARKASKLVAKEHQQ